MTEWQPIDTAPTSGEFLAYGSYLNPDDKGVTEYIRIAERTGNHKWPFSDCDGLVKKEVFTHWMPLPTPPTSLREAAE